MCLKSSLCYRYNQSIWRDPQQQRPQKHEFPSVMEQICFISKGLKINSLFQLYQTLGTAVTAIAVIDKGYLNTRK